MRLPLRKSILLLTTLVVCSCKSTAPETAPPAAAVASPQKEKVDQLCAGHATLAEWQKASKSSAKITSEAELLDVVSRMILSQVEKEEVVLNYKSAAEIRNYEFQDHLHALVFFDQSKKSSLAIRW